MYEREIAFERILNIVYKAIDTEVGEEREELKVETEWVIDEFQTELKRLLGLPEDFHL
jgi:hypothetical protein